MSKVWLITGSSRGIGRALAEAVLAAGNRLVATAREVSRSGRSGLYDVSVAAGDTVIAEFRGHSRTVGGSFIDRPQTEG